MKKQLISLRTSVSFFALGACILLNAQSAAPIDPNPTVISGEVNFSGLETPHAIITQDTSKAIVDYSHFDVLPGGSVEFIQPGSEAAILNRITGNFPSMIEGMITANGQVYFVNPAGVTFGEESIIRADTFLAAAGDLTNEDFLAGNLDFQLSGDLQNAGLIEGANAVALLGRRIKNSGEIVSGNGIVVLASGEHVYLQPVGSSLLVEVSNQSTAPGDGIGIDNQGSVSGDEILFSAGDAYSLALSHSGSATAASSAKLYSDGGSIEVSGNVTAQGGVVEIGGTDRGGPGAPRAARTNITESAVIDISAGESSNAGSAVIWADEITTFLGTVLGEGSDDGAGGSLEISAAEVEMGNNPWKISLGQGGKLLFDPLNVIIDAPLATNIVTQMNAGTFVTVDTNTAPFGGAGAEDGDIIVDAQIQVTNTANQGRLHLNAARDIIINQRITSLQPAENSGFPIFDLGAGRNIEVNALLQTALLSTSLIQLAAEGGTVTISGTGAIDSGGSSVRINSEGDLTIASGAQILSGINTTEFGSVDLHTRGTFLLAGGLIQTFGATVTDIRASRLINQTGVNGLINIGGAGGWQIVLPHPYGETATTNPHTYGGLVSNNTAVWIRPPNGAPSSFGRNSYAFRFQPTIDVSVNNDAKNYGDTSGSGFAGVTIDPTDLIDASLYGNVFKQDTVENILLPDPALASSGSSSTAEVGSYTITASSPSSIAGYKPNYIPGTLTINPRPVTLSVPNQSKTYGNTLTLDPSSFTVLDADGDAILPNGESIDAISLESQNGIDSSTTAGAGTYTDEITITEQFGSNGFDDDNYDLILIDADLVVEARAVTLTAADQSKTYGNVLTFDNTAFAVLDSDGDNVLPNGESIDAVNLNSQTSIDSSTTADVGTYTDEIAITDQTGSSGFDAANYDLSYVEGDLVIGTRAITLTAADQSKTYGNALTLDNTAFAVLDSDGDAALPNGETIDAVGLNSQTSIDSSTTASAGTYTDEIAITGQTGSNGFDANNYDLSYVEGDLVIGTRAVTLTAADQSKTYGNALTLDNTAFAVLDSDGDNVLPNGESIDAVSLNSQTSIDSSTTANVGTYTDEIAITGQTGSNGFDANNYDLSYVEGDLVIGTRAVTLTAADQSKTYGNALSLDNTAFAVLDSDGDNVLPNGESIDAVSLNSQTSIDSSTTASAGTYTDEIAITGQTGSSGFDANNYDLSYVEGDLLVDTRAISISALDQERSFYQSTALDQTAFTLTDADGDSTLPNGELINSANIVSVGGTAGNINALPGVYTDNLTINGQSGSNGFNAQNYVISYTAGDLTVKGPTAQPVLFSEAFSQFSALSSGLSESDPRSNMIIFVPQASLLTLFGDPDWNNLTEAQRMWLISQYDEALSDGITTSYLQNLLNQARAQ